MLAHRPPTAPRADVPRSPVPREARVGTTFVVGDRVHAVASIVQRDRHGAWIVDDEARNLFRITFDSQRRRWVGVPA